MFPCQRFETFICPQVPYLGSSYFKCPKLEYCGCNKKLSTISAQRYVLTLFFLVSISPVNQTRTTRLFQAYNCVSLIVVMAFLIGSSNVYRNFDRAVTAGCFSGREFTLIRCTKKALFDSSITALTSATLVVTSVLENFICDVCTGVPDDEVPLFAHQQITAHLEALSGLVQRLPEVSVIVCPPMFRSTPTWFGSYLPDFHNFMNTELSRLGSDHIGICSPFVVVPSLLEPDGVHLTPGGGDRFLKHLDSQLTSMLVEPPEDIDMDQTSDGDRLTQILAVVNHSAARLDSISTLGATLTSLKAATSGTIYNHNCLCAVS